MLLVGIALFCCSALFAQDDRLQVANSTFSQEQYAEAARLYLELAEEALDWSYGHFFVGLSRKRGGDLRSSADCFSLAINFAQDTDEALPPSIELADTYYRLAEYGAAVEQTAFCRELKESKHYMLCLPDINTIEGFSLFRLGRYREALKPLKELIDSGHSNASIKKALANCLWNLGISEEAEEIAQALPPEDRGYLEVENSLPERIEWELPSGVPKPADALEELTPPVFTPKGKLEAPRRAQRAQQEGFVSISVMVSEEGEPGDFEVIVEEPGGFGFAKTAIEYLKAGTWKPALKNGRPISSRYDLKLKFTVPRQKENNKWFMHQEAKRRSKIPKPPRQ